MQQIRPLFLFIGLTLLILGCDASKKSTNDKNANEKSDEVLFGKATSIPLGKAAKYESIDLPASKFKGFFSNKFEDSKDFEDFKIITKNNADYYLICKGLREKDPAQFAMELELIEGNLILQDVNKLYYTCIARYCAACAFKYNKNGTIGGCDCSEAKQDKPKGYAACEHTIAIKTEEKE
jgi:hypothetical protein